MAQNNLGNSLSYQARQSEGAEGVRLLDESVTAYREALKVYTRDAFPYLHGETSRNLTQAEEELRRQH